MSSQDPLIVIFPGTPGTVAIASNLTLTVYATFFLTIRLLAHRKLMRACQEDKARTKQHLRIITILLESAVINVPITIATAVGIRTDEEFTPVIGYIIPPAHVRVTGLIKPTELSG